MARWPLSLHRSAEPQWRPMFRSERPITLQITPHVCCAMADSAARTKVSFSCNDKPWLFVVLCISSHRFINSLESAGRIVQCGGDHLRGPAEPPNGLACGCQQLFPGVGHRLLGHG